MKNLLKRLVVFISVIASVFISLICISACNDKDEKETSDIGITYFSGSSADDGIIYTIEEAAWHKQWSTNGQGESTPNWHLAINIKIENNTTDIHTPNTKLFSVYYQIPDTEVDIKYWLYEMVPSGNNSASSSTISYIKPEQTAFLRISGNFFYENPTIKYTDNFYLVHKLQTSLGTETKTFNLGVLKED